MFWVAPILGAVIGALIWKGVGEHSEAAPETWCRAMQPGAGGAVCPPHPPRIFRHSRKAGYGAVLRLVARRVDKKQVGFEVITPSILRMRRIRLVQFGQRFRRQFDDQIGAIGRMHRRHRRQTGQPRHDAVAAASSIPIIINPRTGASGDVGAGQRDEAGDLASFSRSSRVLTVARLTRSRSASSEIEARPSRRSSAISPVSRSSIMAD